MINLYNIQIESLSIHKVGNKNKAESLFISKAAHHLNDETTGLLKEYFFKPFREKEESYYRLSHEADLSFNPLYEAATKIFNEPNNVHDISGTIAKHLYDQSNHPHIKSGELYVTYLTGLQLDNVKTDAIGIFKSELKQNFIQFEEQTDHLEILVQQGINIHKQYLLLLVFCRQNYIFGKILTKFQVVFGVKIIIRKDCHAKKLFQPVFGVVSITVYGKDFITFF